MLIAVNTWQTNLVQNYTRVLDDISYEQELPSPRKMMFRYERTLLETCLYNLQLARDDYADLIRLCRPLSERTKQILEINDEDHGKAIMVFTVVTVIFLPLSFATSYFGMNTADIRDMNQTQSLFWAVAIPLTILTVGGCMLIGYNGNDLLDIISSLLRTITGKKKESPDAGGIGVSHRKPPPNLQLQISNTQELSNLDEAEFANPRLDERDGMLEDEWYRPVKGCSFTPKKKLAFAPPNVYQDEDEWIGAGWEKRNYGRYDEEVDDRQRRRYVEAAARLRRSEYVLQDDNGWNGEDAWYDRKDKEAWENTKRRCRGYDGRYDSYH